MRFSRVARGAAALVLALGGIAVVATPSYAACGDTTAEWVGSAGSTWSGTLDGSTSFTAEFLPPALGVQAAATVIAAQSGLGTWVHDYDMRWTSTLAGVWSYRFEVSASSCNSSGVDSAGGGATDANSVVYSVVMTRTA
jgi:hypothetical protein